MRNDGRRPEPQMVSHCCLEPEENLWHGMSQFHTYLMAQRYCNHSMGGSR